MSNAIAVANQIPYSQLVQMANAVAKSGLFAVKSPEAAITLMLIAQAENIHPAQAMNDYDVIQGKPALKASAMLARFQRAGGTVKWLEVSDKKVSGEFTHPAGGSTVITWDDARLKQAGLADKDMHKKFPQQMKRARCISEGVRAVCPGVTPLNMYTPEETVDMDVIDVSASTQTVRERIEAQVGVPVESAAVDEHLQKIAEAETIDMLKHAFQAAYKVARDSRDEVRMRTFTSAYEARKAELAAPAHEVAS
jgi:hypothetical protein